MGSGAFAMVYVRINVTDYTIILFILHGGKGHRADLPRTQAGVLGGVAARSREPQGLDGAGHERHVRSSPDL